MSLTVGFDATAARQRAGIGRYTRELLRALAARDDEHAYRLYAAAGDGSLPVLPARFRMRSLPVSDRITNAIWHRAKLPIPVQVLTGRVDVMHSPDFTVPPSLGAPTIITIHDLAFLRRPECAYPTLRTFLERVVPRSVRRADHLIAVSEATRRDLVELLGVSAERVTVIYEGVSTDLPSLQMDEARGMTRGIAAEPFILSVGTLEPRKNFVRLLEAYALLRTRGFPHRLVIAGRRGWLDEPIFERRRALGLDDVIFVQPDDRTLSALYAQACAFIYPSLYEGFGIPPLEALAAGAPVAVSETSSLPEVVGDAAVTFNPEDVGAIAASLELLLSDNTLASRLRQAGPVQARKFSWDRAAEQTVELYQRVARA